LPIGTPHGRFPVLPTVVLVHGAWADGSSWQRVIPLLLAADVAVVAVQNPTTSLADDVAATAARWLRSMGRWCWSGIAGVGP
jgi:pimeloyl-ACP methyl ester carboxylesterase